MRFSSESFATLAPELAVVDMELLAITASLASPTIALQPQFLITALVELNPPMLREMPAHDASFKDWNAFCCDAGTVPKG